MLWVLGKVAIQHADSGVIYEIDGDDLEFEIDEKNQRERGIEIIYLAEFNHPELGNLTWKVWEYPINKIQKFYQNIGAHKLLGDIDFRIEGDTLDEDEEREGIIETLVFWFKENYDTPENRLPHESKEGGYQWIYGDPCDARQVLEENFPNEPEDIIEAAVEEIESDGTVDWTPIPDSNYSDTEDMFPEHYLKDIDDRLNTLIDNAPKSKTAPAFALGDDGIFHIAPPPDSQPVDNQNNSPKGLRTTIDKLLELLKKGNVHRDLIPIIEDYKEVILGDEISISDLHWNGVILGNMAQAIKDGIDKKEEPPLSLKTKTYLNSVLDLHHTYMMLDEKGQRFMNAGDYRKSAEQIEGLKDTIGQLSNIITESRDLLDAGIRRYVSNVLKGIGQGNHPERSNQSIGNILTNLVSDILGWIKRNSTQTITDLVINKVIEGALGLDSIAIGTVAINGALLLVKIAPLLLIVVAPFAGELSWLASTAHLLERIRLKIKSD